VSDDEAMFEGTWYRWCCPQCSDMNETEEDVRGSEVECESCDWKGRVSQ
jgi:hypothetical protein